MRDLRLKEVNKRAGNSISGCTFFGGPSKGLGINPRGPALGAGCDVFPIGKTDFFPRRPLGRQGGREFKEAERLPVCSYFLSSVLISFGLIYWIIGLSI